jgi:phage terminase large subunit-like protein
VITTYDNLANLTEEFQETVLGSYEGTPVEAQELLGQIVDESTDAAWNLEMIAAAKVRNRPVELIKVVLSVDPAVSSKGDSDETGMAVVERLEAEDGKPWVHFAADLSEKMSAGEFPKKVLSAAHDHNADTVVVEINNGYDFVVTALTGYVEQREGTVIRRERKDRTSSRSKTRVVIEYIISADPCEEWPEGLSLVIKPVWQSKDKLTRAKAASVWWHRGRASHANGLKKAEKQMTTFDGTGRKSPDRLDALTAGVAGAMEGVRVGRPQAGVPTTETANPLPPEGDNKHALIASMASPAGEEGSIWEGRMW